MIFLKKNWLKLFLGNFIKPEIQAMWASVVTVEEFHSEAGGIQKIVTSK